MTNGPGPHENLDRPDPDMILPEGIVDMFGQPLAAEDALDFSLDSVEGGVPLPYCLQVVQKSGKLAERLYNEGCSEALMAEIHQQLAEQETKYPGAPVWDSQRQVFAQHFLRVGEREPALNLLFDIHTPHHMITALEALTQDEEHFGIQGEPITQAFRQRLENFGSYGALRAYADRLIESNPFDPYLDRLEDLLAGFEPNFDPLQSWIDSQLRQNPEGPWPDIGQSIKDEKNWQNVPLRYRQFAMVRHYNMLNTLRGQPDSDELNATFLPELNQSEELYPEVPIWDILRTTLAALAVQEGHPEIAVAISRSKQGGDLPLKVAAIMLQLGAKDQALEMVLGLDDPKLMAMGLIDFPWPENAGRMKLSKIIEGKDEQYSFDQRLACLEVIREYFHAAGKTADARHYEGQIEKLKQQKPNEG